MTATSLTDTSPRIYVACLASYNNAKLHGTWIDADQDEDSIGDEIKHMLAEAPSSVPANPTKP